MLNRGTVALRLLLVDDHQVFRDGFRALLATQTDLSIVGEASDARQAFALAETAHPDVVVLDVSLPGMDGVAAVREISRRKPAARLMMLSMHDRDDDVARAMAAGARGYAFKSQPAAEVLDAIRAVGRGDRYLPPRVSGFVVDEIVRENGTGNGDSLGVLSKREREVFALLVRGLGNDGVARQLCISVKTVETHRARILKKLRVHSIADLVRFAARRGLALD
jgi:DNA-binding NarL/FixJ family response regulator